MTELVKLQAPEGFTDVSFGSQSYAVDENGVVEVPAESAQFLYQFGFGNVADVPAEAEEPAEEPVEEKGKRGRKKADAEQEEQPADSEKAE